ALCLYSRQRPAAAAHLYREAFAAAPGLAEDIRDSRARYSAACVALLAGAGKGVDGKTLDQAARARWRKQGLAWLRAELAALALLWRTDPQAGVIVREQLKWWQRHSDLESVRDPVALARLGRAEQQAWSRLWAEVRRLENSGGRSPAPRK